MIKLLSAHDAKVHKLSPVREMEGKWSVQLSGLILHDGEKM